MTLRNTLLALTLTASAAVTALPFTATSAVAQNRIEQERWDRAQQRFDQERAIYERERAAYDDARRRRGGYRGGSYGGGGGGSYGGDDRYRWRGGERDWDASRYYREDTRYDERVLGSSDEVYRGSDGRYYCRRSDGTTGLIVGAAAGGILGNVIDGGRNRVGGTLIGGALGALLGREVERSNDQYRCR